MRSTPVQGNLDPLVLVAGGEALEQGVERVMAGFRDVPHIFNLGMASSRKRRSNMSNECWDWCVGRRVA